MGKKNRPLPEPPERPYRGEKGGEQGRESPFLLADRMVMAMAEGRLEAFLEEEMPKNEKARKLAMMMMGMTGMIPREDAPAALNTGGDRSAASSGNQEESGSLPPTPEALVRAVEAGSVQEVMELLRREHEKRAGTSESIANGETASSSPGPIGEEQAVVEELLRIADENRLSVDWIVTRALKVYAREYRKTGRL